MYLDLGALEAGTMLAAPTEGEDNFAWQSGAREMLLLLKTGTSNNPTKVEIISRAKASKGLQLKNLELDPSADKHYLVTVIPVYRDAENNVTVKITGSNLADSLIGAFYLEQP